MDQASDAAWHRGGPTLGNIGDDEREFEFEPVPESLPQPMEAPDSVPRLEQVPA